MRTLRPGGPPQADPGPLASERKSWDVTLGLITSHPHCLRALTGASKDGVGQHVEPCFHPFSWAACQMPLCSWPRCWHARVKSWASESHRSGWRSWFHLFPRCDPAALSLKQAPHPRPSMRLSVRRVLLAASCALALVLAFQLGQQVLECRAVLEGPRSPRRAMRPEQEELVMVGTDHVEYRYGKAMPLIFVGGVPRSGTTLMRAMLDAHPEVRCGEETRIIPRVLAMRQAWSKSGREKVRLDEAGVTDEVLDAAMQAFILEVIAKHGEPARVLCNKDPFTLKSSVYLSRLFPNSKFLLMVRDGRASVHSMITRKVTIAGFDLSSYRDCLTKWNKAIEVMYAQCMEVGKDKCLPVYYEQLVLHPRRSLKLILDFLGITWSDAVLHHEDLIGKPGGVSLSKIERSTDQVIKPVNLEALSKWTGHIPGDVVRDMAQIAPMLARLGYDPYANPPNYGNPDPIVINNTHRVLKGDYKTPANLKGYFQVNQNSTSSHLGSS